MAAHGEEARTTATDPLVARLTRRRPRIRQWFDDVFGLDLRTLALIRVGLGLAFLVNTSTLWMDVRAFYSDGGVYPIAYHLASDANPFRFSLHVATGDVGLLHLLFGLQALVTSLFILGWRTKLMGVFTLLLFLSALNRVPVVSHTGDPLLCLLMVWALFTPLGARASLDACAAQRVEPLKYLRVLSPGTFMLMAQMPLTYFTSTFAKAQDASWTSTFSATFYAMRPEVVTRAGAWLVELQPYWVTQFFTIFTLFVEFFGPLLMFLPGALVANRMWRQRLLRGGRIFALVSLTALQLGLMMTTGVGTFPLISTIGILVCLDDRFWTWLRSLGLVRRLQTQLSPQLVRLGRRAQSRRETRLHSSRLATVFVVAMILYQPVLVLQSFFVVSPPQAVQDVVSAARMNQFWFMFVEPFKADVQHSLVGTTAGGERVELFAPIGRPDPGRASSPPDTPVARSYTGEFYPTYRWRRMLVRFDRRSDELWEALFANYHCNEWNRKVDTSQDRLVHLEMAIYLFSADRLHDPHPDEVHRESIFEFRCLELEQ